VDAYGVTGEKAMLDKALRTASFLVNRMIKDDHRMDRSFKGGKSSINAFLDDYALTIQAFLNLYQHTFDETWLGHADGLTRHVLAHFNSDSTGLFFTTSDLDPPLVARRIEVADNVIPGANSVMARNLLLLGELTGEADYVTKARSMFERVWPGLRQDSHPAFYSNWCQLMLQLARPPHEVAIVGPECRARLMAMRRQYRPDVVYLGSTAESKLPLLAHKYAEGQTLIYVCQNKTCKLPTPDVDQAIRQLGG
jgi:hypothetical protein